MDDDTNAAEPRAASAGSGLSPAASVGEADAIRGGRWGMSGLSRRSFLAGTGLAAAAAAVGADLGCTSSQRSQKGAYRAFTDHQAAVVEAAAARLVPGPRDDPAEAGHPGAREANVVGYIDVMLGAVHDDPPMVYGGGPFSNRHGASHDDMADFLALSPSVRQHWVRRLAKWKRQYAEGVANLDRAARKAGHRSFLDLPKADQDELLAADLKKHPDDGFVATLFSHTVEGMYAVPEYGGNRHLVGWKDIGWEGDVQPRGWPEHVVVHGTGRDPLTPSPTVTKVVNLITATAPGAPNTPNLNPGSKVGGAGS